MKEADIQIIIMEYTSDKKTIGDVILKYWNAVSKKIILVFEGVWDSLPNVNKFTWSCWIPQDAPTKSPI